MSARRLLSGTSLATQLRLGFACALAFVVASWATIWWIAGKFEHSARSAHANVTAAAALAKAESALWELRYGFPRFMVGDAEARRRILADQSKFYAQVEANLDRYASVAATPREREMVTELRSEYLRYKDARPKFFELYGTGRIDEAVAWNSFTTKPYGATMVEAFGRQIALLRKRVEADVREDIRQSATSRAAAISVSATLLALLAAGFWAALRALVPIGELRDRAQAMLREQAGAMPETCAPDNEVEALVDSFNHMSERLRAHTDSLRASNERLDYLLGATPAVIYAARPDGDRAITYISPNIRAVFGFEAEPFIGDPALWQGNIHPEDRERVKAEIASLEAGRPQVSDFRLRHADGSWRWARAVRNLKCDASGTPVERVGYLIDVTELKHAERMKDEFISTVSHELRTPLTSIRGSLGLIAGGVAGALPPMVSKLIDIASANSVRLIGLVNNLLDAEKMASGRLTLRLGVSDLGSLVGHVIASNEGFARQHKVPLRLVPCPEALRANVDPDHLHQAVTNLVSNAVKFSPPDKPVEVRLLRRDTNARIEVCDRGPGIPEEFRARIFQRFSQADGSDTRRVGGSGLGLAITRGLVERMGGAVGYESVVGEGSTFYIELPALGDTPAAADVPEVRRARRGAVELLPRACAE